MNQVTAETFEQEVLKSAQSVVVKFSALWCGPCRMIAPMLDQLAAERPEVKFVEVDVDKAGSLARDFSVLSVPTVLKFEQGKATKRVVGFVPKDPLEATLFG